MINQLTLNNQQLEWMINHHVQIALAYDVINRGQGNTVLRKLLSSNEYAEVFENMGWDDAYDRYQCDDSYDANRGGLMVRVGRIDGFLPVSQLTAEHYPRVDGGEKSRILELLQKFIGQQFVGARADRLRVVDHAGFSKTGGFGQPHVARDPVAVGFSREMFLHFLAIRHA